MTQVGNLTTRSEKLDHVLGINLEKISIVEMQELKKEILTGLKALENAIDDRIIKKDTLTECIICRNQDAEPAAPCKVCTQQICVSCSARVDSCPLCKSA